tara:strand:+ start:1000 stop:1941 length:942 start_codon:yes stop_codon:yes gene_type:complete
MTEFSHVDEKGNVKMVDVTNKLLTVRVAKAEGKINMRLGTIARIKDGELPKGNVLNTAKIAGIQAAKKTSGIIPLCHQLNLSFVDIEFEFKSNSIWVRSIVKTKESTGVEMEALSAVSIALLTIYDMCKAVDKTMEIDRVKLIEKKGGKSDHATRYRPKVGVVTLSDGVVGGKREDMSGEILADGFLNSGCVVDHRIVLEDGSDQLVPIIYDWIDSGVELILTTGGTGLSPRDLTIEVLESIFESKLNGVEQALHAYGRGKIKTAMLSRLTAGLVKGTLVICLPGSPGATRDALEVLIPTIFHSFHMLKGEQH